jgi:uncharacterized protein (TIGR01370 family)
LTAAADVTVVIPSRNGLTRGFLVPCLDSVLAQTQPQQPLADSLMVQFVLNIRSHINSLTPNPFFIIPQNGEDVINSANVSQNLKTDYLSAINGVGAEDVFFYGNLDEDNTYNPDTYRIQQLQEYLANGKRVFSIEYLISNNFPTYFKSLLHIKIYYFY